eukprot:jgi/Astpho2/5815/fgenesh1_pg.00080_%23_65_t
MVNGQDCSIDVRGDGGCIIISPTTYLVDQERKAYKWLKPLTSKQDLLACPSWLIDILNNHSKQTGNALVPLRKKPRLDMTSVECHHLLGQVEKIMTCSIGKTWTRINGFDFAPVDRSIGCPTCPHKHFSNNWCMRCVVGDIFTINNYSTKCSIKVYGWETHPIIQKLLAHPNVDDPYVDLLVAREQSLGRGLSHDGRSFYEFDGICWAQVEDIAIMQSVRVLGYEIMAKLVFVLKKSLPANNKPTNDDERKLADQIKQFTIARGYVQKAGNVRSITDSAKQLLYDRDFAAKLDTNPDLLACQNGVLDLTTGELREGRPDDNLSKKIAVDYRGLDLDTPDIDRFMWSVFEDQEVVSYLQMLLGYAITGHMREELWVIMYGSGSNGKSILNNLIKGVMGDSHVSMDKACLIKSARPAGKNDPTPYIAALHGKRVAVCDEIPEDATIDDDIVKRATTQTMLTARYLNANPFSFNPQHFSILLTNHKPKVNVTDDGILRRTLLCPFGMKFKHAFELDDNDPSHRLIDTHLSRKLSEPEQLEQMLVWMVKGAVKWHQQGLPEPPSRMRDAKAAFVEENDILGAFIQEFCNIDPAASISTSAFKQAFEANMNTKMTAQALAGQMKIKGYKREQQTYGRRARVFQGINLADENMIT